MPAAAASAHPVPQRVSVWRIAYLTAASNKSPPGSRAEEPGAAELCAGAHDPELDGGEQLPTVGTLIGPARPSPLTKPPRSGVGQTGARGGEVQGAGLGAATAAA
jgi:hypothetical protein